MKRPDIDAIEQRANAATPGPWSYSNIDSIGSGTVYNINPNEPGGGRALCQILWDTHNTTPLLRQMRAPEADANGTFMATAREDVESLIGYIRYLEGEFTKRFEQAQNEMNKALGKEWTPPPE